MTTPIAAGRRPARFLSARDRALVVMIVLVAVFLRMMALGSVPPGLHFDEAVYGLLAEDIRQGARPIFFSAYTGREPLYMYAIALMSAATGPSAYVIRLTSALAGIVTVALAFALGRALHGRRVGIATAGFVALSYWHLTVSRNGYPNVFIPPLEAAAAIGLWRGWMSGSKRAWILGGALSGLVLYTYLASRLWPVALILVVAAAALSDPERYRRRRAGISLALVAALAVLSPLLVHFALHPEDIWERAGQVLASRELHGAELMGAYMGNTVRSLQAIALPGLGDPRWHFNLPGRPMWTLPTAALLALGAVIAIRRARDLRFFVPLVWVMVMAVPGLLTLEMQPAGQRMFGVFPALALLPAIGLAWLAERLRWKHGWPALLAIILAWEGAATVRDCFGVWANAPEVAATYHAEELGLAPLAREALDAGSPLVILSEHYRHPTVAFVQAGVVERAIWADPRRALPVGRSGAAESAGEGDGEGEGKGEGATIYLAPEALLHQAPLALAWLEAEASERAIFTVVDGKPVREASGGGGSPSRVRIVRYTVPPAGPGSTDNPSSPPTVPNLGGELAVGSAVVLGGDEAGGDTAGGGAPRAELRRDRPVTVTVPIDVIKMPPPGAERSLSLRLIDPAGRVREQVDQVGVVPSDWRGPARRMLHTFTFASDPTIPPGRYGLALRYSGDGGLPMAVNTSMGVAEEIVFTAVVDFGPEGRQRADPATTTPRIVFRPSESGSIEFDSSTSEHVATASVAVGPNPDGEPRPSWDQDGLAVLDARVLSGEMKPGDALDVEIEWARTEGEAPDSASFDIVLEHDGQSFPLRSEQIAPDYPPREWSRRERLTGRYQLTMPDRELEGSTYDVWLSIPGTSDRLPVGIIALDRVDHRFEAAPPGLSIGAMFEVPEGSSTTPNRIELIGLDGVPERYDLEAGAWIEIQWRAERDPERDLKVFVHLVDAAGAVVSQHDSEPAEGGRPMRSWLAGEIVTDGHRLPIPPGGPFRLAIGLYDAVTGERMEVVKGDGSGLANESVTQIVDRTVRVPLPPVGPLH